MNQTEKNPSIQELKELVDTGTKFLEKQPEVKQAEVFASWSSLNVLRICYASNIPSNGLEEAKLLQDFGVSIRVLFKNKKTGFGKQSSMLSLQGIQKAFEKAKKNTIFDKDFKSLPSPSGKKNKPSAFDKKILDMKPEQTVDHAYTALNGALDFLEQKKFHKNLNITGELDFLSEKIAIANTNGINEFDQNTKALSTLTTIFELEKDVSGMWLESNVFKNKIDFYQTGKTSAQKAFSMLDSTKTDSGKYNVVFGKLAIADILFSRFELSVNAIEINASPFSFDLLGKQIANEQLNIFDNGTKKNSVGTKKTTDEGIPTKKTQLVKNGVLENFLANDYYTKKFPQIQCLEPSNGFRLTGNGRNYALEPSIHATNIEITSGKFSDQELLQEIKNGLYIGRIWYTYPVNGAASPDFTSTVRGDSFIVKNGQITKAIIPNTLRLNENIHNFFSSILAISKKQKTALAWGEETVLITPEIAVKNMHLEKIAKGLY